jgi:hypothetical protein
MGCVYSMREATETTMMAPRALYGTLAKTEVRKISTKPTSHPVTNWDRGDFEPERTKEVKGKSKNKLQKETEQLMARQGRPPLALPLIISNTCPSGAGLSRVSKPLATHRALLSRLRCC